MLFVNTFINFDARQTDQGWSRADLSLWIESKNLTHTPMPRWKQAQSELFTDNASLGLMKCGRAALQLVLRHKWYRILCLQRASVQKRLAQLDQGLHIRLFGQWCQVPIDSTNMLEKSWEQVKLHLSSLSCITHHNSPWIERWCHRRFAWVQTLIARIRVPLEVPFSGWAGDLGWHLLLRRVEYANEISMSNIWSMFMTFHKYIYIYL